MLQAGGCLIKIARVVSGIRIDKCIIKAGVYAGQICIINGLISDDIKHFK